MTLVVIAVIVVAVDVVVVVVVDATAAAAAVAVVVAAIHCLWSMVPTLVVSTVVGSAGTWLNRSSVIGKGNIVPLRNGDEVSLVLPRSRHLVFSEDNISFVFQVGLSCCQHRVFRRSMKVPSGVEGLKSIQQPRIPPLDNGFVGC